MNKLYILWFFFFKKDLYFYQTSFDNNVFIYYNQTISVKQIVLSKYNKIIVDLFIFLPTLKSVQFDALFDFDLVIEHFATSVVMNGCT